MNRYYPYDLPLDTVDIKILVTATDQFLQSDQDKHFRDQDIKSVLDRVTALDLYANSNEKTMKYYEDFRELTEGGRIEKTRTPEGYRREE